MSSDDLPTPAGSERVADKVTKAGGNSFAILWNAFELRLRLLETGKRPKTRGRGGVVRVVTDYILPLVCRN